MPRHIDSSFGRFYIHHYVWSPLMLQISNQMQGNISWINILCHCTTNIHQLKFYVWCMHMTLEQKHSSFNSNGLTSSNLKEEDSLSGNWRCIKSVGWMEVGPAYVRSDEDWCEIKEITVNCHWLSFIVSDSSCTKSYVVFYIIHR